MNRMGCKVFLTAILLSFCAAGCSDDGVSQIFSEEARVIAIIENTTEGKGIYGGELVGSDTLVYHYSATDSVRWVANWDFFDHFYSSILFDTVTDQADRVARARMWMVDTIKVSISLIFDSAPTAGKSNYATATPRAVFKKFEGWSLRDVANRSFYGPPDLAIRLNSIVITKHGSTAVWSLSRDTYPINSVPQLSRGDSLTVEVATTDPQLSDPASRQLFLNVKDGGTIRRIRLPYDAEKGLHRGGWVIAANAGINKYYPAFIEAYSPLSLTSSGPSDTTAVGISGHTFAYLIR